MIGTKKLSTIRREIEEALAPPGGADAEVGPDVDSVDLFFSRPEADALREDLGYTIAGGEPDGVINIEGKAMA